MNLVILCNAQNKSLFLPLPGSLQLSLLIVKHNCSDVAVQRRKVSTAYACCMIMRVYSPSPELKSVLEQIVFHYVDLSTLLSAF